jgi:radical SAM superfamily enzyme YgiQ (UPF0313 family)
MRILFVYSLSEIQSDLKPLMSPEAIAFGISYIAGLLEENGHETDLVVLGGTRRSMGIIDRRMREFAPDLVGFSIMATQHAFLAEVAVRVKANFPGVFLLAGGPHVSINPEQVMTGVFDAACIGEGEYPTLELVQKLSRREPVTGIANLWIRRGQAIEKNDPRPFLEDLDALPFPNRDMWFPWISEHTASRFSILLGRGCHFDCTYCSNHALRRVAAGRYVRFRSAESILTEIMELQAKFPDKKEYFLEIEAFNADPRWMSDLCEKLRAFNQSAARPLVFGTNLRITPHADFARVCQLCAAADIRLLTVGVESGSERIRREVLHRDYSNADVLLLARQARENGLRFGFQNMIGLPGETEDDFRETIALNRACQPDWYYLSIFFPYPGTMLAQTCEEMKLAGRAPCARGVLERKNPYLDLPAFPRRRLMRRYFWFEYDVYRGRRPGLSIAAGMLERFILSRPWSGRILRRLSGMTLLQRINRSVLKRS